MLRLRVPLAVGVVLLASLAGCTALSSSASPSLKIVNQDATQYHLMVFTESEADSRTDVTFQATTGTGDRRYVGLAELQSGTPYSNVTLVESTVQRRNLSVPPIGNATTDIEEWESGDVWGYIIENSTGSLVAADVITCQQDDQSVRATISDGYREGWTASCH